MSHPLQRLNRQIQQRILGQEQLVNRMLIALLADGHLLVEGAPGLAKTRAIKVLAALLEAMAERQITVGKVSHRLPELFLVMATRQPEKYSAELARWIEYAASPRATIALDRCARAHAWLAGRDYVSPEDVQAIAPDVLRHRLLLSFEAEGVSSDDVMPELLARVPVP